MLKTGHLNRRGCVCRVEAPLPLIAGRKGKCWSVQMEESCPASVVFLILHFLNQRPHSPVVSVLEKNLVVTQDSSVAVYTEGVPAFVMMDN